MRRRAISVLLTLTLVAALVVFVFWHWEEWARIRIASPVHLVWCWLAMFVALISPGPVFRLMVNRFGPKVGLSESTAIAVLTTAVNIFVPFHGGAAMRAAYLKRKHGLDLTAFAATFVGYNVLRLLVASVAGLVAAVWLALAIDSQKLVGLAAAAAGCLGLAAVGCSLPPAGERRNPVFRRIAAVSRGWHALRRPRSFLAQSTAWVAVQFGAELAVLWAAWAAVGVELTPAAVVLIGAFGVMATLTGLTPNGLGVFEIVVAAVGTAVAVDPVQGIAGALVARGVLLASLLAAAPISILALGRTPTPSHAENVCLPNKPGSAESPS